MGTTWQSLIWKEWHEHKWKLASIAAVLFGVTTLSILVEERDKLGLAFGMLFMCVIPLAAFVGLGTAANEQSRSTLAFLQAQPIPLWHVGLVKLIASLLTVIVPVVLTSLSIVAWRAILDFYGVEYSKREMEGVAGGISTGNFFVDIAIFGTLLAMSLVIWTAAAGVNRKDEVSAGAVALTVILGWVLIVWTFSWLMHKAGLGLGDWGVAAALSLTPGFAAIIGPEFTPAQVVFAVCASSIVHLLLAASYVRRFGRTMERPIVSPKVATRDTKRIDWLDSPRRSPLTAVVWKQCRESGPIALAGLAGIVGTAVVIYVADEGMSQFALIYTRVSISLGFCIALVVGIGVALQDMGPRFNTFWRSRPIDGNLWFWAKFATGFLIMIAAVYVPQVLFAAFGDYSILNDPMIAMLHISTYAAAVAMTCLIRHAVYAAILSVGALTASMGAFWLGWKTLIWLAWIQAPVMEQRIYFGGSTTVAIVFTGMVACFLISTGIGWLAMRNDWGWKSRF